MKIYIILAMLVLLPASGRAAEAAATSTGFVNSSFRATKVERTAALVVPPDMILVVFPKSGST